jgi:hypothetical protein
LAAPRKLSAAYSLAGSGMMVGLVAFPVITFAWLGGRKLNRVPSTVIDEPRRLAE